MAPREAASAGALALVALAGLAGAVRLDVGGLTRPGPGFFPLLLSLALLAVSAVLLAGAARRAGAGAAATPGGEPGAAPARWRQAATLGALMLYVALFERVGFVTATAAFLAFLFAALGRYRWPVALGTAVAVAFAARVLFDRWLSVRLPPDFWGR
jgi:putative tricarboxylic transport membrane protein